MGQIQNLIDSLTAARDARFLLGFPGRAPEWIDLKAGQTLRLSTAD